AEIQRNVKVQDKLKIRQIKVDSKEYYEELKLRDEVLRKPLKLSLFDENLDSEKYDFHIGVFLNNLLVGVLILTPLNNSEIKMRQVAIHESFRGKGIGTKLVIYAEEYAKNLGCKIIILNSRKTAVEFYEKLGYTKVSEEFIEVTIPHYKMQKMIG
ncbi:MAG TPA: GNAT family N-acetyltransferase, partial [Caldisericia bacterium]|nr:GNAT family N-acetyltransferase [Caldisericia bacterium]